MSEIKIVELKDEDIPALVEIEKQEFSSPWDEKMFRQEIEDNDISRAFIAHTDGKPAGYFVSWFIGERVHLLNIAVSAPFKRKGIGSLMLKYLIDVAVRAGKKVITLEVRESNEGAISFYRAFGFEIVGVKEEYYQEDKEDALLMVLWLRPRRNEAWCGKNVCD